MSFDLTQFDRRGADVDTYAAVTPDELGVSEIPSNADAQVVYDLGPGGLAADFEHRFVIRHSGLEGYGGSYALSPTLGNLDQLDHGPGAGLIVRGPGFNQRFQWVELDGRNGNSLQPSAGVDYYCRVIPETDTDLTLEIRTGSHDGAGVFSGSRRVNGPITGLRYVYLLCQLGPGNAGGAINSFSIRDLEGLPTSAALIRRRRYRALGVT